MFTTICCISCNVICTCQQRDHSGDIVFFFILQYLGPKNCLLIYNVNIYWIHKKNCFHIFLFYITCNVIITSQIDKERRRKKGFGTRCGGFIQPNLQCTSMCCLLNVLCVCARVQLQLHRGLIFKLKCSHYKTWVIFEKYHRLYIHCICRCCWCLDATLEGINASMLWTITLTFLSGTQPWLLPALQPNLCIFNVSLSVIHCTGPVFVVWVCCQLRRLF